MANKILIIDDDQDVLDLMRFQLNAEGYKVETAASGEEALKLINEQTFDVTLTDLRLPDVDGIDLVKQMKGVAPETEIIVITGYGSVDKAVASTKAGAFYFIEKPVEFEELQVLLEKALERRQQADEIKQLRGRLTSRAVYGKIIGSSKAMQNIYEMIDSVADSDANVLIIGESGTGKELIANTVHYKSLRAKKTFVKINCSALPKELIESELFGHTKGAFTGATGEKPGLIAQAYGGSLMLDEIAEMPLELQPKLLRVLQERVYYQVGSEKAKEADFRLISATNRNPYDAMRDGCLREDLYYRINTIEIQVPPLRERAEDISTLAEHFLQKYGEKYNRPTKAITQQAYERMFEYAWPGNVRELQNVMERAVLLSKGDTIEVNALPFAHTTQQTMVAVSGGSPVAAHPLTQPTFASNGVNPNEQHAVHSSAPANGFDLEHIGRLIVSKVPNTQGDTMQEDIFKQLEIAVVNAALERTKGNKQAAANLLGLYRPRLYSIIKRHSLQGSSDEPETEDGISAN